MTVLEVPIKVCSETATIPAYAHIDDAGVDLHATSEVILAPFERGLISTGICLAIPAGFAGFVLPRSGLAIKQGLSLVNSPGLIDSNYRGEIQVIAINLDPHKSITICQNDRIAQLVILRVEAISLMLSQDLPATERGDRGFGSSGVAKI